jgi:hypothetical protein
MVVPLLLPADSALLSFLSKRKAGNHSALRSAKSTAKAAAVASNTAPRLD